MSETRIQLRRGTSSQWTSINTILSEGELGLELDTHRMKIGDGLTAWNDLVYSASPGLQIANVLGPILFNPNTKTLSLDNILTGIIIDSGNF